MKDLKKKFIVLFAFSAMLLLPVLPAQAKSKVKISQKNLYIQLGSTKRLRMTGTKKTVRWKSTNPWAVTVKRGYVHAKRRGNAEIIAKSGKHIRKCKVRVVSIDKYSALIKEGGRTTIWVQNGKNSRWSSSNPSVATVSKKGVVTGKKGGYAWITCRSRGFTFRCIVRVASLNRYSVRMRSGSSCKITCKHSNQKRRWSSSNTSVATVDQTGKVVGVGHGTAVIRCRTGNAVLSCTVSIIEKITTSRSSLPASTRGSKAVVKINQFSGTRTYTVFSQSGKNKSEIYPKYLPKHGCGSTTAVNVLSGMTGKVITPATMVEKAEKIVFGEKEYWNNYTKSVSDKRPVSLYGISRFLRYFGVKCTYVRTFKDAEAIRQIREHLYNGNPVVIEVSSKNRYTQKKDKKWSNSKHTMALLGLTDKGYAIIADPANRDGFGHNQRIKYETLENLIQYMFPCKKTNSTSCYYVSSSRNGGYILVNK